MADTYLSNDLTQVLTSREFLIARGLCEDGGESEYVRACAEMVCDLTGTSMDYKESIMAVLIA